MVRLYSSSIRMLLVTGFALTMGPGLIHAQDWAPDTIGLSQNVGSLAVNASGDIFAGTQLIGSSGTVTATGVYLLANNGKSWSPCPSPTFGGDVIALGPVYGINTAGDVFVGAALREAFTTNKGNTWTQIEINNQGPSDPVIDPESEEFAVASAKYILAATDGGASMELSADGGLTWNEQGCDNSDPNVYPTFAAYDPSGIFFAGTATALYKSDGTTAQTWGQGQNNAITSAPSFGNWVHFAFNSTGYGVNSTIIVAGGTNDLFLSTDNGSQWSTITPSGFIKGTTYSAVAIGANGHIYAGLSTGGMYESTDTGQSWNDISPGLPNGSVVSALAIAHDSTLYAGTNNGVFKYLTSTFPAPKSGVALNASTPASLTLAQNTPNPVTTSTDIQFSVPTSGSVSLLVYDATGREVATVASGYYAPGTYNVSFDAQSLCNGAYYYRITSGGQNASRMFVIEH